MSCPEPWQAWHTRQPPAEAFGDASPNHIDEDRIYWTERHWLCPINYSAEMWYANELLRLEDRGPA